MSKLYEHTCTECGAKRKIQIPTHSLYAPKICRDCSKKKQHEQMKRTFNRRRGDIGPRKTAK